MAEAKKSSSKTPPIGKQAAPTGFRPTPELRAALVKAAKGNGRSLSQEIESRLERSFSQDDALTDAFGDGYERAIWRTVAAAAHSVSQRLGKTWTDHLATFTEAEIAAHHVLRAFRPRGIPDSNSRILGIGAQAASEVFRQLASDLDGAPRDQDELDRALAVRIAELRIDGKI